MARRRAGTARRAVATLKTALLTVVENTRLYGNTYCMWFDAPELLRGAAPGRFLMLRCADAADDGSVTFDPLLPRAMSYSTVRKGKNGDEFCILKSVVVLDGARDVSGVYPAEMWPDEVELIVTTQDGSAGRKGLVTDVFLDYFEWSDTVFTCGPNPMFAALADVLRTAEGSQRVRRRKPVQALLESPMGCGTGICYGCAVFDRRGTPRLVCKEGPRFDIRDIW